MSEQEKSRRIMILNGFGNNLGDQAIFAGTVRVFGKAAEALNLDLQVDQSFIYDFPFRESTIETLNESYDLVVLGGGGFIYHRPTDQSPSGWGFDIPEALIKTLKTPFAIYGTGYNYRAYSEQHFPEHTASHMRETVARAAHFSVREHTSMEIIRERFGVEDKMSFMPDAALHVQPAKVHLPIDQSKKQIAVCLRLDRAEERFAPPFAESFERYIKALVGALKALTEEGYGVVFTPHLLTRTDMEVGRLLKTELPSGSFTLLHEAMPSLYGPAELDNPALLAGVYERMHLVLGQRLHSVIMPFSVDTPAVSVSSTASNAWMQEEFGTPKEMHLDLMEMDRDISAERIADTLRWASARRDALSAKIAVRKAELIAIAEDETKSLLSRTLLEGRTQEREGNAQEKPKSDVETSTPPKAMVGKTAPMGKAEPNAGMEQRQANQG